MTGEGKEASENRKGREGKDRERRGMRRGKGKRREGKGEGKRTDVPENR